MQDYYAQGRDDVFASLGITKVAVPIIPKAPLLRRAKWWLSKKLPKWGRTAKEMAIGSPKQFMGEIAQGKALAPGSLIRQSFHAPGLLNKAFWYGLPAYEGIQIMRSDEPGKAARMGGLLGGTALGIAAWRPLGILGSMGLGMLGERVGAGIGQTARHLTKGPEIQPQGRWMMPAQTNLYPQTYGVSPQYPGLQNRSWVNR